MVGSPGLHIVPTVTRDTNSTVVLLGTADVVGEVVGDIYMIELGGDIILFRPSFAAVDGDVSSAVIGVRHPFGVVGINPEIVLIAVGGTDLGIECDTAVHRFVETGVEGVDRFPVPRISHNT